jgi:hypothetical protein
MFSSCRVCAKELIGQYNDRQHPLFRLLVYSFNLWRQDHCRRNLGGAQELNAQTFASRGAYSFSISSAVRTDICRPATRAGARPYPARTVSRSAAIADLRSHALRAHAREPFFLCEPARLCGRRLARLQALGHEHRWKRGWQSSSRA